MRDAVCLLLGIFTILELVKSELKEKQDWFKEFADNFLNSTSDKLGKSLNLLNCANPFDGAIELEVNPYRIGEYSVEKEKKW